ncbi:MAG: DinB family protein [Anaerolineae bacterium]|nr:DinB family protein [Anaerolineae bacterium]
MVDIDNLIEILGRNQNIVERQADGLSHEDSLLQLPFRGNCFNWILGHVTGSRNSMLKALQAEPIWTETEGQFYKRGSAPLTDGTQALRFEQLLADFCASGERVAAALKSASPEILDAPSLRDWSVAEHIRFLTWHETYHVGQLEFLRQLAGKNDQVIQ